MTANTSYKLNSRLWSRLNSIWIYRRQDKRIVVKQDMQGASKTPTAWVLWWIKELPNVMHNLWNSNSKIRKRMWEDEMKTTGIYFCIEILWRTSFFFDAIDLFLHERKAIQVWCATHCLHCQTNLQPYTHIHIVTKIFREVCIFHEVCPIQGLEWWYFTGTSDMSF